MKAKLGAILALGGGYLVCVDPEKVSLAGLWAALLAGAALLFGAVILAGMPAGKRKACRRKGRKAA